MTASFATYEKRYPIGSSYQSLTLELQLLAAQVSALETYEPSEIAIEGIGLATRIFDVVGRLAHNFYRNLTRLLQYVKRSELRAYLESHTASMRQLYQVGDQLNLDEIMVPVPDGMTVGYLVACGTLNTLYAEMKTREVVKTLITILKQHERLAPGTWVSLTGVVTRASISSDYVRKDHIQTSLRQIFVSDRHSGQQSAADVIGQHVADIKTVAYDVLKFESAYQTASAVHKDLQQIDELIGKIIDRTKKSNDEVSREYIQQLSDFIRVTAVQFDMHGVIMAEMQRVEHNFTIGLARIIKSL